MWHFRKHRPWAPQATWVSVVLSTEIRGCLTYSPHMGSWGRSQDADPGLIAKLTLQSSRRFWFGRSGVGAGKLYLKTKCKCFQVILLINQVWEALPHTVWSPAKCGTSPWLTKHPLVGFVTHCHPNSWDQKSDQASEAWPCSKASSLVASLGNPSIFLQQSRAANPQKNRFHQKLLKCHLICKEIVSI